MARGSLLVLFFTSAVVWQQNIACENEAMTGSPRTSTTLGELIGTTYSTYSGRRIYAFYGVPYAKPPIGELRFEPPQPVDPWKQPRKAKRKSEVCIQPSRSFLKSVGSENCLYLDVYTPLIPQCGKCEKYLPIMLYIHPSAFFVSSGTYHEPFFSLDLDKHDHVFVPINYRLGILGYFSTGDLVVPGNNGQKDQVMALRWIKEHARSFCGDPDQITIAGSSAGSASVGLHMVSPLTRGLFSKVIGASGNPYMSLHYRPLVVDFGRKIAEDMSCASEDSREMVNCLKTKPAKFFWNLELQFRPFFLTPIVNFGPVLEPCHNGSYITKIPEVYFEQEEIYDVPTLSLFSEFEGLLLLSLYTVPGISVDLDLTYKRNFPFVYDFNSTTPPNELANVAQSIKEVYYNNGLITLNEYGFKKSLTDRLFACAQYHYLLDLSRRILSKVYFLLYTYRGEDSTTVYFSGTQSQKNYGAGHTDVELLAIFDGFYIHKHPLNEDDTKMMRFMTELYYSFMVKGEPSEIKGIKWKPIPKGGKTIIYLRVSGPDEMKIEESDTFGNPEYWDAIPRLPNRGFPYANNCNKTYPIRYHKG